MHASEISKLIGKVERAGYTLVPLNLHFSKGRVKCEIGLAKGKKQYDKRGVERVSVFRFLYPCHQNGFKDFFIGPVRIIVESVQLADPVMQIREPDT